MLNSRILLLLGLVLGLSAPSAVAEDRKVVIELYTSQGCSSCPPADALLERLAERDDVIALSLHVDYWDYIGWKDVFGRPENTKRQKVYARVAGSRTIYTPQMVIGGVDHVVGAKPMDVADLLEKHKSVPVAVALSANAVDGAVVITAPQPGTDIGEAVVQIVRYRPAATVSIKRGENAGQTLNYTNIVTEWDVIGTWSGDGPLEVSAELAGDDRAVAIVQKKGQKAILAAVELP
ncbi:thioredoxin family protein [Actibacterium sp. 188UL27-1]|uniref:DUF1223 domain-containing protein n=1 Tax=Actibacterium sp. 188UL27-1 TaxID=2786961 RepID=UPI00195862F0|nr:DUF1223 domain-containing protein [Actibacterium sp. 188UL27-1]MBM7069586.1 DUF1223 domain-containing protein [Actibacterium sp. 188UL27-1]